METRHEGRGSLFFCCPEVMWPIRIWVTADTRVFVFDSAPILEMGEALAERVMS